MDRDDGHFGLEVCAESPRSVLVTLWGELDLWSVPRLEAGVARALGDDPLRVTLDLARLEFMDARGVGALCRARGEVTSRGAEMGMCEAQAGVRRIMTLCALDHWLTREEPRDGAAPLGALVPLAVTGSDAGVGAPR